MGAPGTFRRLVLPAAMPEGSDVRVVTTSLLKLALEDRGPSEGFPLVLAHGWPDSVRTWDPLLPSLHEAGYRTIAYHLRGFGPTRFRESSTLYSGQPAAHASDLLELTRLLGLERFAVIGHDWGARAGETAAALEPGRVAQVICLGGLAEGAGESGEPPIERLAGDWYQWFFALPQAKRLLERRRDELARYLWQTWSPTWAFSADEFAQTAAAFDNPKWAEVTLHAFRHRWGLAIGDGRYREVEARLAALASREGRVPSNVPVLAIQGGADQRQAAPGGGEQRGRSILEGPLTTVTLPGVGHFPQREAPARVAHEILAWLTAQAGPGGQTGLRLH